MTQEEKQLLLIDLCARLPYGVICQLSNKDAGISITEKLELGGLKHFIFGTMDVLPYLRPMSSMTEEEKEDQSKIVMQSMSCSLDNSESATTMLNDWLLSKHFDVRGLISKGLALEAPEGMYKQYYKV